MKGYTLLTLMFAVFILPLAILVIYSLAGVWSYPDLLPETLTLRGWLFLGKQFCPLMHSLLNSTLIALATVALSFLITVMPASVLARYDFPGRTTLEALLLAPVLIPVITFSMGIHHLFIVMGLADTALGVILILTAFAYPYMLRALIAGFSTYSADFDRCAENLGAGVIRRTLQVHIPLLLPSILSGGTVVFLVAFSEYFLVFLIGGGAVSTYTSYLFPYLNSSDRTLGAALTLLFMIIPLGLFFFVDVSAARAYRKRGMDF